VTELTLMTASRAREAVFEFIPSFPSRAIRGHGGKDLRRSHRRGVQHELEQLRESRAVIEPVEEDRALKAGDWAQITYKGLIDGEPEAARWRAKTPGGNWRQRHCGGFHEALRGANRPGTEGRGHLSGRLCEPKLAGKTVSYSVEVKAIKKRIVPELTDEFAKELGQYESLADLESRIREHMAAASGAAWKRDQGPSLRRAHRALRVCGARISGAGAD